MSQPGQYPPPPPSDWTPEPSPGFGAPGLPPAPGGPSWEQPGAPSGAGPGQSWPSTPPWTPGPGGPPGQPGHPGGAPPWGSPPPGPPWQAAPPPGMPRPTPKVGRGDVRSAILVLLAEQPLNGYQLIQGIQERSGGVWRPSPGSVYPALQQLETDGLVQTTAAGTRREYDLTAAGRAYVEERWEELSAVWSVVTGSVDTRFLQVRALCEQVNTAVLHIMHTGDERLVAEAQQSLANVRRDLYRILADAPVGEVDGTPPVPPTDN
jgi:DNA-binding PadR family transcriptional regulator